MDEPTKNIPTVPTTELILILRGMKGKYPMSQEALLWMQGFVCSHNERLFHVYDHFPSFDNGWDSALQATIDILEKTQP